MPQTRSKTDSGPHTGVRTFETMTWWRRKMLGIGFERSEKDFYFFVGGPSGDAPASGIP